MEVSGRDIRDTLVIPRGLFRLLRKRKPTLIVTEDLAALPASVAFCLNQFIGGNPYLIWSLGDAILGKERSWFRYAAAPVIELFRRGAAGFICYSDWATKNLADKYGKPTYTAYNSTIRQSGILQAADLPASKYDSPRIIRLLFIGRLLAQKKVNILLDAISRLDANVELDIVGSGPDRENLLKQCSGMGLGSRVRFHGAIHDTKTKNRLIDMSHLAVLPGLGGLFIQEAYCRGLPVLCGPADGTEQDLVKDVNPKLYLSKATADSMATCIQAFIANPNEAKHAAVNAVMAVRKKYNLENMADRWVQAVVVNMPDQ
jgi:glycosyltransferase involved in cell wall biosynthesis